MFTILNFLSSKSRKDWRLLFDERLYHKMQIELAKLDPQRHDSLSQIKIQTNPRLSTQHAFTIKARLDSTRAIVESPEEEQENETPISDAHIVYSQHNKFHINKNNSPNSDDHDDVPKFTDCNVTSHTLATNTLATNTLATPVPMNEDSKASDNSDSNNMTPLPPVINMVTTSSQVIKGEPKFGDIKTTSKSIGHKIIKKDQRNRGKSNAEIYRSTHKHDCKALCGIFCHGPIYLQSPLPDRNFLPCKFCVQLFRRVIILCYGMILFCYGTLLIIFISLHFSASVDVCEGEISSLYPELELWRYCSHKVYPFITLSWNVYYNHHANLNDGFYPCQCRSFFMTEYDFVDNVNVFIKHENIIESIFENWWMLQMIVLHDGSRYGENNHNLTVVLDKQPIKSSGIKIVSMKNVNLYINDENIFHTWKHIEFLRIDNGFRNKDLPLAFGEWKNLKYLSLIGSGMNDINDIMCNFKNLKYLSLENSTNINILPFDCMYNTLNNIQYINLNGINAFDAQLFQFKNLRQYVHYYGDFVIDDLLAFNVNTFNDETDYYLQGTSLCIDYNINNSNDTEYINIYNWINKTQACYVAYNDVNKLNICPPMKWRNGICDNQCNDQLMLFDGGDCQQM